MNLDPTSYGNKNDKCLCNLLNILKESDDTHLIKATTRLLMSYNKKLAFIKKIENRQMAEFLLSLIQKYFQDRLNSFHDKFQNEKVFSHLRTVFATKRRRIFYPK